MCIVKPFWIIEYLCEFRLHKIIRGKVFFNSMFLVSVMVPFRDIFAISADKGNREKYS